MAILLGLGQKMCVISFLLTVHFGGTAFLSLIVMLLVREQN